MGRVLLLSYQADREANYGVKATELAEQLLHYRLPEVRPRERPEAQAQHRECP